MADTGTPRRRSSDHGWRRLVRENWYRDVWLLLVTVLLVWALWSIQNERWKNVRNGCEATNQRYVAAAKLLDEAPTPQSKQQRELTLRFITALTSPPHFDRHGHSTCDTFADGQVSRWP